MADTTAGGDQGHADLMAVMSLGAFVLADQ
jgi:hypothetical protein